MPFGKKKDKDKDKKEKAAYPTAAGGYPQQGAGVTPYPVVGYPGQYGGSPYPASRAYPQNAAYPPGAANYEPPPPYSVAAQQQHYPPGAYGGPPQQAAAYPPQPTGYNTQYGGFQPTQPQTVVMHHGFDAGARFDMSTARIPPPPPGCMPNAAQMAAQTGANVVVSQRPSDWMTGGSDAGYVIW